MQFHSQSKSSVQFVISYFSQNHFDNSRKLCELGALCGLAALLKMEPEHNSSKNTEVSPVFATTCGSIG